MGLVHSRASKKRDRTLAELTRQQAGIVRDARLRQQRDAARYRGQKTQAGGYK